MDNDYKQQLLNQSREQLIDSLVSMGVRLYTEEIERMSKEDLVEVIINYFPRVSSKQDLDKLSTDELHRLAYIYDLSIYKNNALVKSQIWSKMEPLDMGISLFYATKLNENLKVLPEDKAKSIIKGFIRIYFPNLYPLTEPQPIETPDVSDIPVETRDVASDIRRQSGYINIVSNDEMNDIINESYNEEDEEASQLVEIAESNIRKCLNFV